MKTINKLKLNLEKQTITRLTSLQIVGGNEGLRAQENRLHLETSCETGDCH